MKEYLSGGQGHYRNGRYVSAGSSNGYAYSAAREAQARKKAYNIARGAVAVGGAIAGVSPIASTGAVVAVIAVIAMLME